MIDELLEIKPGESVDELRARLGRVLGWHEPVPLAAFRRATEDPDYAGYLLTSRDAPGFLGPLLNDPANARYLPHEAETAGDAAGAAAPTSSAALAGRAAKALVQWGKAGFSIADDATIARREAACLACPNLVEPQAALQKLVPSRPPADALGKRTGDKVCAACGCQVAKKLRLPSEACPVDDPDVPGTSRWGEPTAAAVRGTLAG